MYKIILTAAEETSAMSVFEGTNPQDLFTEDWDIADWSAFNGLLMEDLVDLVVEDFGLQHEEREWLHIIT